MTRTDDPRQFLRALFAAAINAVHPDQLLTLPLPPPPRGRTIVLGAGKAAASMAAALERRWPGPVEGLVVTRYDHQAPTRQIEVVQAAHPVPDQQGIDAAGRIMALADSATADDLVIVVMSGGASSLLVAPAPGISLGEKQEINRALLRSGAPIGAMNCVRRRLSAIKGGRLARRIDPAPSWTLVISDVPGDDPAVVGSGPTVADPTTAEQAMAILDRYRIEVPASVRHAIENDPGAGEVDGERHRVTVLATAQSMLQAAAGFAREHGITPVILGDDIEIDAEALANVHAALARQVRGGGGVATSPAVLLSGGESSVAVRGDGRGGRNMQFLLALALALDGLADCHALAADSDGIDGSVDDAGGIIGPDSLARARAAGLDPGALLGNNDAHRFLAVLDDLVTTGPTRTNVNDFRALLLG